MLKRYKKFTVIECIVMIAILAILFALILYVLSSIKGKSYQIDNVNNLKQIGIAMNTYTADYNGMFPYIESISDSDDKAKILWLLLPDTNYNINIFYPVNSMIYNEEKNNSLLKNPKLLYNLMLTNPTDSRIPRPGYAYSPLYFGEPLSFDIIEKNIPIAANYTDQYNTITYYLNSDGSVHKD